MECKYDLSVFCKTIGSSSPAPAFADSYWLDAEPDDQHESDKNTRKTEKWPLSITKVDSESQHLLSFMLS